MLDSRHMPSNAGTSHEAGSPGEAARVASGAAPSADGSSTPRTVDAVYRPPPLHWVGDGFRVHGYFNTIPAAVRRLSPFLLLDYHPPYEYSPTNTPRGVGVHPHRGFETVTLAFQGSVAHHDSAGNGGVIGPGDAQWMTAASGILHKEYHEAEFARRGGTFHMAQLWVNLPREHKMAPPRYQGLTARQMGEVTLPDGAGVVRVIAGEYEGARGPAKTFSPVTLYHVRLNVGGSARFTLPRSHNTAFLVMEGAVTFGGQPDAEKSHAKENDFVLFKHDGDTISVAAQSDVQLLVMSGEPIDEPVVQYGPFVMNSQQEIIQAVHDFNDGKFGHLDD
jgi:redox-sensitive bicupin YhaK (pirin superfamily)